MNMAIIVPRYGEQIVGGAETLARTLAEYMAQQQWNVTVLTTCAQDYVSWENSLPEGTVVYNDVTIRRFPITSWDAAVHNQLNIRLNTYFFLPLADQYQWLSSGPHASGLYTYLQEHKEDFDTILVLPYLSTITQYAAWVAPEKTLLIPCLHEESHAFMELLHRLMETVKGVLFLTPEERTFALDTLLLSLKRHTVMGMGLDYPTDSLPLVNLPNVPYIIAASRLETGKNLALLYEYAQRYVDEGGELKLLLLGAGNFTPLEHPVFETLGFVPHEQKLAYMRGALALCQPSLMESFSIVIMESWQMGRPVLVHRDCAVTSGHVNRSGGGFTFASYKTFADAIDRLKDYPNEAALLGKRGKQYVFANYRWPLVATRLQNFLDLCATQSK